MGLDRTHTKTADQKAFDDLYEAMQKVEAIAARAIREGEKGYKRAIKQIMEICQAVE
jgi:hypothetical protein